MNQTHPDCLDEQSPIGALCMRSCGLCNTTETFRTSAFNFINITQTGEQVRYSEGPTENYWPVQAFSSIPVGTYQLSMADSNTSAHLINDGSSGTPNIGCQPLMSNHSGKVVLVDRGKCWFSTKVQSIVNEYPLFFSLLRHEW